MAASSSYSQKSDVFPSFRGEDVRTGFLSHLRMELDRGGLINTFNDNGIERSCEICPELLCAIREARISIVIFSENYASSKWCLDELAEIHYCYKELKQKVIPVFYKVDPSEVRKQNGEFGKVFLKTCEGKTDDVKQRWKQALTQVANLAGEHLQNWPDEASMVKKIANDVFNKLLPPSNGFGDFVGIEAHIEAMESILCLESEEEVRMIGIWGQSGIGKSTLGRALHTHLSPKFPLNAFVTYKSTDQDVFSMKLFWENQLLTEIFDKNIEVNRLGMVEKMLNEKKVLIILDDVVKLVFLEALVGKTEWFGPGSRIIVITQDQHLLKAHGIDLLYEVKIPAQDIALKMLCRNAFAQDSPPDDFREIAVEVAKVAGNLPLGLSVLGSSLKGRTAEEWKELLPGLKNGLKGDIVKTLKASYDRLEEEDQDLFLWIASLFNGMSVKCINDFFGDNKDGLKRLAEKSLIRITSYQRVDVFKSLRPYEEIIVEMHNLLQKLGREIVRAESKSNSGKRRFLTDATEVEDVLTHQTGTETLLGIYFDVSDISIDEKSFEKMFNLQFLKICNESSRLPTSLVYLPTKLKSLHWTSCPLKCLPSSFKAEFLVELILWDSKLEKLWDGTQQLGSLKTIIMRSSFHLKKSPDLSKAINLERVDFVNCDKLESFSCPLSWESLDCLDFHRCPRLKNFPGITLLSFPHGTEISVYDCLWNKSLPGPIYLDCLRRYNPSKFLPQHIVDLKVKGSTMEKLCEGVQSLGRLQGMNLSYSENLKEIPDLSKATNLTDLDLSHCISLGTVPSTIRNLQKLKKLEMKECTRLKVLPVDVNLSSLQTLNLNGCSSLTSFPQISSSIEELYLDDTAIEEVPCLTERLPRLTKLSMRGCSKLTNFPQLSSSTEELYLDHTAIEEVPCCIEMFPKLIKFSMCGCSSLTSFPQIPLSIENLYLDDTSIEEVPCCIEMFRSLTILSMSGCNKLKSISANIFRLTDLKQVDFTDCGGVIIDLSGSNVMAKTEDPYNNIENRNKVDKKKGEYEYFHCYFHFQNCLRLDRGAKNLIIQSSFKSTVILPGGRVPKYFKHRARGNSQTVTLPQSSLSHQVLRFNVCVAVKLLASFFPRLYLYFHFNGVFYMHAVDVGMSQRWKTDHLVLFSFKFQTTCLPSELDINDVEFKFEKKDSLMTIKEFGIRLLNVSPSTDDKDGRSSKQQCNNQSGEKCDVVETESSNKQMQMTSSEENFNLPRDQIGTDTGLTSPKLALPLGRGESSSVSSYPCPEEGAKISEQQDTRIPIAALDPQPSRTWPSLR